MKTHNIFTAFLISAMFFFCHNLTAQVSNIWLGGSPGNETEWNCYKNWSLGSVPDWSSDVVIPDVSSRSHHSYPVISGQEIEVNSLVISTSATLQIENDATLIVFFEEFNNNGILNLGRIIVNGTLEIGETFIAQAVLSGEDLKESKTSFSLINRKMY